MLSNILKIKERPKQKMNNKEKYQIDKNIVSLSIFCILRMFLRTSWLIGWFFKDSTISATFKIFSSIPSFPFTSSVSRVSLSFVLIRPTSSLRKPFSPRPLSEKDVMYLFRSVFFFEDMFGSSRFFSKTFFKEMFDKNGF